MKQELLDLKERIESELHSIQQTSQRVLDAWDGAERFPDQQSYYLDSVALNLHSFYNGLDPVFPSGPHWHRELLNQMAREIPETRPAILSSGTPALLGDFLAFRHLIRSLYAFDLDAERLKQLVRGLPEALSHARQDLENFCRLLSIAAGQDGTEAPDAS